MAGTVARIELTFVVEERMGQGENRAPQAEDWPALPPGLEPLAPHFRDTPEVHTGPGWWDLVRACHDAIVTEFPNYELVAVKEKNTALYVRACPRKRHLGWTDAEWDRIDEIAEWYGQRGETVCERCGSVGQFRASRPRYRVLCDECEPVVPRNGSLSPAEDDGSSLPGVRILPQRPGWLGFDLAEVMSVVGEHTHLAWFLYDVEFHGAAPNVWTAPLDVIEWRAGVGLPVTWSQMRRIAQTVTQIFDGVFVGYAGQEVRLRLEVVDSGYWIVAAEDQRTLAAVRAGFEYVQEGW